MKKVLAVLTVVALTAMAGAAVLAVAEGPAEQRPGARGPRFEQRGGMGGLGQGPGGQRGRAGGGMMGRGGRGPEGRGGPGDILAGLDLSSEQREAIQKIRRDADEPGAALGRELMEARQALHQATFADSPDGPAIADLTTKILALEKQHLDATVKTQLEIAALLTAEQRKKVRR